MRRLEVRAESWPLGRPFAISRGAKTKAEVVVVRISEGEAAGRGECVPYPRYGETVEGVLAAVEALRPAIEGGLGREELQTALAPGAARNAVDCALWDLEAKLTGVPVWQRAGLAAPAPLVTAFTIGLGSASEMADAARAAADRPLLKVKLAGAGDLERVQAVRAAAPRATLVVDANEAWTPEMVERYPPRLAGMGVALIEQPLPADDDAPLAGIDRPVPVCADESCHVAADVDGLRDRYDMVNVKLDKAGGLTEALRLVAAARAAGLGVMVGCMVGTSLAMAPAMLLGGAADYVDLDGPLLLARDRPEGLESLDGGRLAPPRPALWG